MKYIPLDKLKVELKKRMGEYDVQQTTSEHPDYEQGAMDALYNLNLQLNILVLQQEQQTDEQVVVITESHGNANIEWDCRSLDDVMALLKSAESFVSDKQVEKLRGPGSGPWPLVEEVKPYLRPMESMTEEERMGFTKLFDKWHDDELFDYIEEGAEFSIWKHKGISPVVFDWLNANHFDYRGLIEKGLALEAPEEMYKTE